MNKSDIMRMFQWLLFSAFCYGMAQTLTAIELWPQIQVVFWKVGHLAIGANLGYWVDRCAFKGNRITVSSPPMDGLRRALIIAAAMLAISGGM